jgi:hypothetical protein
MQADHSSFPVKCSGASGGSDLMVLCGGIALADEGEEITGVDSGPGTVDRALALRATVSRRTQEKYNVGTSCLGQDCSIQARSSPLSEDRSGVGLANAAISLFRQLI